MTIQVFEKVKNHLGLLQWIFTPEQRDEGSGKIPDFLVERVCWNELKQQLEATHRLCMEYKKMGGDPVYKALRQLINATKKKLRDGGLDELTIYLVVVVGTKISFWEIDFEGIDGRQPEEEVASLWGVRSLTQTAANYEGARPEVFNQSKPPYTELRGNIPQGVKKLLVLYFFL